MHSAVRLETAAALAISLIAAPSKPLAAIRAAKQPTLIVGAMRDDMIAIAGLRRLQRAAPEQVEMIEFDAGHFDPYVASWPAPNLQAQVDFLRRTLSRG